ncbi:OsmC family protein [Candidatus Palauibacter sp.]|uniref:OsmC family protein n=1 Tax=Candidatus Palauibacter sp. TaxID=3101350 RepID=UPI003B01CBBE
MSLEETREETQLRWNGGLEFTAERAGFETRIDGDQRVAPSPVALLVEAVAACAAIDVVHILRKGRQPLTALSVSTRFRRSETAPRYVKGLKFEFHLAGQVDEAKARRAVMLSFEKYCSVYHSLRKDMELEWTLSLNGEPAGGRD